MKAKTAQWKMKNSLSRWGMSTEFWQDVLQIIRDFEKSCRDPMTITGDFRWDQKEGVQFVEDPEGEYTIVLHEKNDEYESFTDTASKC